ncbi:MAG TPA: histidine kinase [Baekduia sp.]|nr:histidine kinase [Baekduia sp.]
MSQGPALLAGRLRLPLADVGRGAAPRPLAWRLFLANAAVILAVAVFLVVTPATISSPVLVSELLVLVAAIIITLFVNVLLIERLLGPLDDLGRLMRDVDPLQPGRRVRVPRADADVAALSEAFNAMLERLETERRESARRALAAQESERLRVARELHDELGQLLTGVLLLLDEARGAPAPRAEPALEEAREAARSSIEEVRRIVRDLRPEALDDLGIGRRWRPWPRRSSGTTAWHCSAMSTRRCRRSLRSRSSCSTASCRRR